jgi:hypothetical protein
MMTEVNRVEKSMSGKPALSVIVRWRDNRY